MGSREYSPNIRAGDSRGMFRSAPTRDSIRCGIPASDAVPCGGRIWARTLASSGPIHVHNLNVANQGASPEVDISAREAEVLAAVGEHLTNAEIGARLFISTRTVESHVSSLLRKLQADDRRALAAISANPHPVQPARQARRAGRPRSPTCHHR